MKPVAFRVGLLAGLLSHFHGGKWIGVMITASHNPVEDNGVKLVDPQGEMVIGEWETVATELANTPDSALQGKVAGLLLEKFASASAAATAAAAQVRVVLARDTRPSGIELSEAVRAGILTVFPHAQISNLEEQTTPELHFNTFALNSGHPTPYIEHFSSAFEALLAGKKLTGQLVIDAANGVGAENVRSFSERLGKSANFDPILINSGEGQLNFNVRRTTRKADPHFNCVYFV